MSNNLSELLGRKGVDESLFDKMGKLSQPDESTLATLADEFLIGKANAFGTASFYDFLKPENKGKKVYVCNGTACLCAGTQDNVIDHLKAKFTADEIGHMTCLGRCHENSAFHYGGKNYSGKAISELDSIVNSKEDLNRDNYQVKALGKAILTIPFTTIDNYYQPFLEALKKDSSEVLEEIKLSNVRGRGGAGFPMGMKLEFCRKEENKTKFIICNADEGDPGAYSDRYLLEERTHSVLFYVTHASYGIIYIRAEYPEAVKIVQKAIDELKTRGLVGDNINGSGFNFHFKIIQAQGSYICGEETALIISNGGDAWKIIGTERSSGTKLVSLDSLFNNPGIYEVEMGTQLSVVVNDLGGGFKRPVKAMQIGGPLGGLVPVSKIDELTIDFESFSQSGFLLGHASIVCIPEEFSMMKFIEHLFEFASYESCGKCFPCRLGTKRGQELAEKALVSDYKIDRKLFTDLLTTLEKGSLCAHGGGIPLPVRNAMQYFDNELKSYFN